MGDPRLASTAGLNGETISGLALAATGLGFAIGGARMSAWEDGVPGPGLAPALLGMALCGLGLAVAVLSLVRPPTSKGSDFSWAAGKALAMMAVGVAAFETVGFLPTIFLYMFAFIWLVGREPWPRALAFSAAMSAALWLLFVKALGVGLPAGLLRLI